jgi:hypothetical protein
LQLPPALQCWTWMMHAATDLVASAQNRVFVKPPRSTNEDPRWRDATPGWLTFGERT